MKLIYRLMCKGYKNSLFYLGKNHQIDRNIDAIHYSKDKYVICANENVGLQMIRDKHHLNIQDKDHKWNGFKIVRREE